MLDLGIDAWYYGETESNTDTTKFDTDVIDNDQIDEDDLLTIVTAIFSNNNYEPNN